jgi:hypothetical protein
MSHSNNPKTRQSHHQLFATLLVSLSLITPTIALAEKYKRPSAPDPANTTVTGTRTGSCSDENLTTTSELTALAPHSYVGQTVSTHPTFAWFVPNAQPYQLKFQLSQYDTSGKPQEVYKTSLQSEQGLMKVSLPKQHQGLSLGQKYVWQVVLICNPNKPSEALKATAEIKVAAPEKAIQTQLATAKQPLQKAEIYAASGFWYDAWAATSIETRDLKSKDLQLELLNDLARSEETNGENTSQQRGRIEQIVQLQRQQNSSQLPR